MSAELKNQITLLATKEHLTPLEFPEKMLTVKNVNESLIKRSSINQIRIQ